MDERLDAHLEIARIPNEEFAELAFRLALRRDPEPEARERLRRKLADCTLSRATLLHELVTSKEFGRVRAFDDAVAHGEWAHRRGERPRELRAPAWDDGRLIELPWVLGRYRGDRRVLETGYVHAEAPYLAALVRLGAEELVGVDLAERGVPGLRSVVGDLRELPLAAASFDLVLCVSTLEHVGMDTSAYGHEGERDEGGMERALLELRRVVAPDGRVLITLPLGERRDFGWYIQLELDDWHRLFTAAGFAVFEEEGYALDESGWYAVPLPRGDLLCAELRPRRVADRLRRRISGRR
jgi:SAM-dependent methyltransferase